MQCLPIPREDAWSSLAMCSCDVSREGGEENKPRGITACNLLRSGYVVGLAGAGGSRADCSS